MEAPSLMNKGYSTMHQQKQLQSPATMQSNNKQFGVGNHGHMIPRPLYSSSPIVGQKRDSSAFDLGQGVSQDGGNFVKLFVGHLPRNVTEDDIRSLFAEHGNVLEVSLVRDNKRIGQQHGCCFIKYATVEEAERAIKALHNQHTLQGGVGPLQVRYADGEREQLGTVEHKLFVGSLNKQATEKEIEEIFTPYGTVDDVYIMRDEQKQSRGCAFVKFPSREMAAAAISGLNGAYVMRGCNQPLAVRFAEPKRPKPGDTRGSPAYGGPGFGTELQRSFGSRPSLGVGSHMGGRGTPTNWRPMGAANMRTPSPQVGPNPYVSPSNPSVRGGSAGGPPLMGGPVSGSGSSANGPPIRAHISSPMGGPGRMPAPSQQLSFNSSPAQRQTQAHGWSASVLQPRQMQQQLQPPMQQQQQQHPQSQPSFSQLQPQQSLQQYGQQFQTSQPVGQQQQHPFAQASASQQPLSLYAQFAVSQPPVQQPVAPLPHQTAPSLPLPTMQLQHQQQSQPQSQQQPALQPVHQHSHALQPNFQSQQHPSLQQQQQHAPLMQTATQSQQQPMTVQPQQQQAYYQMASTQQPAQQQPWTFSVQTQAVASTVSVGPASVVPTTITVAAATAAATAPVTAPIAAAVTCVWSEHTSPEGHKYYYNSVTGESKWEKPEELTVFEQQQQAKHLQQPRLQPQSQPQLQSQQQPQPQLQAQPQLQPQPQLQSQQQQQQQAQLMSSNLSYGQLQAPNTTVNPVHHYAQQQSLPATQDWMWKARPAGT